MEVRTWEILEKVGGVRTVVRTVDSSVGPKACRGQVVRERRGPPAERRTVASALAEAKDVAPVGGESEEEIWDLLYDPEPEAEIRQAFPGLTIHPSYDAIHEWRLEVSGRLSRREWYSWLVKTGWGAVSLSLQLALRDGCHGELFKGILAELDREQLVGAKVKGLTTPEASV